LAAPGHLPVPRAQTRYGGGDSLTIWRRQGKTSRIKALTMPGFNPSLAQQRMIRERIAKIYFY
jgi:hypothetical protein